MSSSHGFIKSQLLTSPVIDGEGSSASRAAVFFLALAFAFTSMFENVCSNAVAGGIDLAGLFPRYIDIRRGALITFFAAWIIQPWQLINQAATFVAVLNSFAVFLAERYGTGDFSGVSFLDASRLIATEWKNLPEEEKQVRTVNGRCSSSREAMWTRSVQGRHES